MSDPLQELERQVERGNLFAHSVLTEHASRANETEALLNGLVALLVQHKVVDSTELMAIIERARPQVERNVEVAVRVDQSGPEPAIDCEARLPICKAACCRLHFALSVDEIEGGQMKWELGRPYFNRHKPDGYCHQWDDGCTIYEDRPSPCRLYSCEGDDRIWKDFDGMVLNEEWMAKYLDKQRGPVEIFMDAYQRS